MPAFALFFPVEVAIGMTAVVRFANNIFKLMVKMNQLNKQLKHPLDDLIRTDRIPHIWCPGCGIGIAFSSTLLAMKSSEIDLQKTAMVSGIGCSGRGAGYVNLDSYHTTHGRAIPFATGLKLANPKLNVVVFSGDGDLFAIGGNHFIHAIRRNPDITNIIHNNMVYGLTKGQASPTSEIGFKTPVQNNGVVLEPFNPISTAISLDASFVARAFSGDIKETKNILILPGLN